MTCALLGVCLWTASSAGAFTVGPAPIDAGLVSVSDISLNGTPGNTIIVAPGADVMITGTVTNQDGCVNCVDYTNVAFRGQFNAGCFGRTQGDDVATATGTVDLGLAPTAPGTYDVIADTEEQFACGEGVGTIPSTLIAQVQVAGPGVAPTPPPAVALTPSPATCGAHTVDLLQVARAGKRVIVSGSARATLHGQSVKITGFVGSKRVGHSVIVTIQGDGSFSTVVALPGSRATRAKVRYRAAVAGVRSRSLKLARQITIRSQTATPAGVVVAGTLAGATNRTKITLALLLNCTTRGKVGSVHTDSKGRFTITLPRPAAPAVIAYYRFSARRAHGTTFSLPIAVARLLN